MFHALNHRAPWQAGGANRQDAKTQRMRKENRFLRVIVSSRLCALAARILLQARRAGTKKAPGLRPGLFI
jgi:hypothetical protein